MYDLNSRGDVVSGVVRLRALRFDMGSIVALAPAMDGFEDDCVFFNTGVSDEVHLRAVGAGERQVRLSAHRFLTDAKHACTGDRMIRHSVWPQARTAKTASVAKHFAEARIFFAG